MTGEQIAAAQAIAPIVKRSPLPELIETAKRLQFVAIRELNCGEHGHRAIMRSGPLAHNQSTGESRYRN
jgi:hypothetical protein